MSTIKANLEYHKGYFQKYDARVSIHHHGMLSFLGFPEFSVIELERVNGGAPPAIMADFLKKGIRSLLYDRIIMTRTGSPGLDTYLR
jgi:hypothetical protein